MANLTEIREEAARIIASSTTTVITRDPSSAGADLLAEVIKVARASGWRGRSGRGNPARVLKKSMSIVFSGTRVRGVAEVNWEYMVTRLSSSLMNDEPFYLTSTYLRWTTEGVALHPHDVGGALCFRQIVSHAEIARYRNEGILARWLVGIVGGAYLAFNPLNFGNSTWRACEHCHAGYHLAARHLCAVGSRGRGLPTTARFRTSLLVGCGVTGSWSLPVISRVSGLVFVFDRDTVDPSNPNGRWPAARSRTRKITAAVEPRFRGATMLSPRDFTQYVPLPPIELAVLAPDSAEARLLVLRNQAITTSTWIVDFRVADGQLNVWCFKSGSLQETTWRIDLESYGSEPNRCAHDNVSIVAGVMASAFLSWWATRDPLVEGIWTIPINRPWENMAAEQPESSEEPEREPESDGEEVEDLQPVLRRVQDPSDSWIPGYQRARLEGRLELTNAAERIAGMICVACGVVIERGTPAVYWRTPNGEGDWVAIHFHENLGS